MIKSWRMNWSRAIAGANLGEHWRNEWRSAIPLNHQPRTASIDRGEETEQ